MPEPVKKLNPLVNHRDSGPLHETRDNGGGTTKQERTPFQLPNNVNSPQRIANNPVTNHSRYNYPMNANLPYNSYMGNGGFGGVSSHIPYTSSYGRQFNNNQIPPATAMMIHNAQQSTTEAFSGFLSGVQTLGNITVLLDSTVMNVIGLFNGVLDIIGKSSMVTSQFSKMMSLYSIYKAIRYLYYKLLSLLGFKTPSEVELAWREASSNLPHKSSWYRTLLAMTFLSIPVLLYKLAELIADTSTDSRSTSSDTTNTGAAPQNIGPTSSFPQQPPSGGFSGYGSSYGGYGGYNPSYGVGSSFMSPTYGMGSSYPSYGIGSSFGNAYGATMAAPYGSVSPYMGAPASGAGYQPFTPMGYQGPTVQSTGIPSIPPVRNIVNNTSENKTSETKSS